MNPMACLNYIWFVLILCFVHPEKSTQKEVVKAVNAELVVAKVAAVNPNKKTIAGIRPNDFNAISGNKKSVPATPFSHRCCNSIFFCKHIKQSSHTQEKKVKNNKYACKSEHVFLSFTNVCTTQILLH